MVTGSGRGIGRGIAVELAAYGVKVMVKAGVIGLTTSIAREAAPYNINVNVIPVPTTDTPGLRESDFEFVADELPLIPMGRIAVPKDIANTVLFLVSEAADYVTGQIVAPNGGKRMLV